MTEYLKVRLGTPADEDEMLMLSMMGWRENGLNDVSPEKMREVIKPALYLWGGLVGVVGEPDKPIEAAIVLRITQLWYGPSSVLEEKAIFVHPDFRKKNNRSEQSVGHARALCDFAKHAAEKLDLPLLIGVLSNQRTEAKIKLYERQFGKPAGAFFLYNARTGTEAAGA